MMPNEPKIIIKKKHMNPSSQYGGSFEQVDTQRMEFYPDFQFRTINKSLDMSLEPGKNFEIDLER